MEATLRTLSQVGGSRVVLVYLDGGDTQNADTGRWIKSCFSYLEGGDTQNADTGRWIKSCCSYLDGSDTQNADAGRWITVLKVDVGQGGAEAASQ